MAYLETKRYLESLANYEQYKSYPYEESLDPERIKGFLDVLGDPQRDLRCIHIAGTKGKGSTAAFIAYILREAGFRVGLYTSPHLSDFRERIRILEPHGAGAQGHPSAWSDFAHPGPPGAGKGTRAQALDFEGMISRQSLSRLVKKLKPAIHKYNRSSKYGLLTFFEVYTAIAFLYFKKRKSGFVVLETGLGGRLDATNAAQASVCAITPISYEHTQLLGSTLAKIAAEKAGIIKNSGSVVVSAPQENEAAQVIRRRCCRIGAKLYEVGRDIKLRSLGERFSVKAPFGDYRGLRVRLLGRHQAINAAVSLGVIDALRSRGINIPEGAVKKGLYRALWPGRCEVASKNPLVILDGAQNTASAAAIKKAVRDNFKYRRLILVLGVSSDKDIKGICKELRPLADEAVLTRSDNSRAADPADLMKYFKGKRVHMTKGVKDAKALVMRLAGKDDLVLVTGSLFVVGEFRALAGV